MRALHVPAAGEQAQLSELPTPEVAAGTVLIRVKAAGLNALDNALAAGMMAGMFAHEYPLVLGRDAAGVVEAVGAGVEHVKAGDEVFGHVRLIPPIQLGTLAEYALLPAETVVLKPAGLTFTQAAALPLAASAASAAIDAIDPQAGQVVLVNGATGGVGSYAVQLLKARGATVVATGTAADVDRLKKLGADKVVDYTAGSVAEQVRGAYPDGADALLNFAGYSAEQIPLAGIAKGGKVATTTQAPDDDSAAAAGLTVTNVFALPLAQTTAPLAAQAAAGDLVIDVHTVLPFDQAADGLATLASGNARGKIVVTIG